MGKKQKTPLIRDGRISPRYHP